VSVNKHPWSGILITGASKLVGKKTDQLFHEKGHQKSTDFFKSRVGNGQNPSEVAEIIYATARDAQSDFRAPMTPEVERGSKLPVTT